MDLGNIIHNDIMLRFFALYVKIEKKQKNTAKIYSKEIRNSTGIGIEDSMVSSSFVMIKPAPL